MNLLTENVDLMFMTFLIANVVLYVMNSLPDSTEMRFMNLIASSIELIH